MKIIFVPSGCMKAAHVRTDMYPNVREYMYYPCNCNQDNSVLLDSIFSDINHATGNGRFDTIIIYIDSSELFCNLRTDFCYDIRFRGDEFYLLLVDDLVNSIIDPHRFWNVSMPCDCQVVRIPSEEFLVPSGDGVLQANMGEFLVSLEAMGCVVKPTDEAAKHMSSLLTVSSAHIKDSTARILKEEVSFGNIGISVYSKDGFGWFIYLEDIDEYYEDVPEDLLAVMKYAKENGADILCLDSDGYRIMELPTYED